MNEEERDSIEDMLPKDMLIWSFEEELGPFSHADVNWWMETLGHPRSERGHCTTCGLGMTCLAAAFHEATVTSVIRELDKLGLLKNPEGEK